MTDDSISLMMRSPFSSERSVGLVSVRPGLFPLIQLKCTESSEPRPHLAYFLEQIGGRHELRFRQSLPQRLLRAMKDRALRRPRPKAQTGHADAALRQPKLQQALGHPLPVAAVDLAHVGHPVLDLGAP